MPPIVMLMILWSDLFVERKAVTTKASVSEKSTTTLSHASVSLDRWPERSAASAGTIALPRSEKGRRTAQETRTDAGYVTCSAVRAFGSAGLALLLSAPARARPIGARPQSAAT